MSFRMLTAESEEQDPQGREVCHMEGPFLDLDFGDESPAAPAAPAAPTAPAASEPSVATQAREIRAKEKPETKEANITQAVSLAATTEAYQSARNTLLYQRGELRRYLLSIASTTYDLNVMSFQALYGYRRSTGTSHNGRVSESQEEWRSTVSHMSSGINERIREAKLALEQASKKDSLDEEEVQQLKILYATHVTELTALRDAYLQNHRQTSETPLRAFHISAMEALFWALCDCVVEGAAHKRYDTEILNADDVLPERLNKIKLQTTLGKNKKHKYKYPALICHLVITKLLQDCAVTPPVSTIQKAPRRIFTASACSIYKITHICAQFSLYLLGRHESYLKQMSHQGAHAFAISSIALVFRNLMSHNPEVLSQQAPLKTLSEQFCQCILDDSLVKQAGGSTTVKLVTSKKKMSFKDIWRSSQFVPEHATIPPVTHECMRIPNVMGVLSDVQVLDVNKLLKLKPSAAAAGSKPSELDKNSHRKASFSLTSEEAAVLAHGFQPVKPGSRRSFSLTGEDDRVCPSSTSVSAVEASLGGEGDCDGDRFSHGSSESEELDHIAGQKPKSGHIIPSEHPHRRTTSFILVATAPGTTPTGGADKLRRRSTTKSDPQSLFRAVQAAASSKEFTLFSLRKTHPPKVVSPDVKSEMSELEAALAKARKRTEARPDARPEERPVSISEGHEAEGTEDDDTHQPEEPASGSLRV